MAKYKVTQSAVEALLAMSTRTRSRFRSFSRPFVWDSVKVRDLLDSLYNGYPVGTAM